MSDLDTAETVTAETGRLIQGSWLLEPGDVVGYVDPARLDTLAPPSILARVAITARVAASAHREAHLAGTLSWADRGGETPVTVPLDNNILPRREGVISGETGRGIRPGWLTYLLDRTLTATT